MKKTVRILSVLFVFALILSACNKTDDLSIDANLLPGKWQDGSYYEYYYSDGNAKYWDTAEDVHEDEGIAFTWKLEGNVLTQYHPTTFGTIVPKVYTVSTLNSTNFSYHDDYGVTYSFVRIN